MVYVVRWVGYRWWFDILVKSGREQFAALIVAPASAALTGAATAVGLDHVLSDTASPHERLIGWYLLGGGVVTAVVAGTVSLLWLSSRETRSASGLAIRALRGGNEMAEALDAVAKEIERHRAAARAAGRLGRVFIVATSFSVACIIVGFLPVQFGDSSVHLSGLIGAFGWVTLIYFAPCSRCCGAIAKFTHISCRGSPRTRNASRRSANGDSEGQA